MGSAQGRDHTSQPVRVALVGCTGLLGEILTKAVSEQRDFAVVPTPEVGPSADDHALDADIVVWNEADEDTVRAWLRSKDATPRILATLGDGRDASWWELTPHCTPLGALSPSDLVDVIRAGARRPIEPASEGPAR